MLGVWRKWVKHAKYIYNIQDFNPVQVLAVGFTKSNFIIMIDRTLVATVKKRNKGKKVPKTVIINVLID